MRSPLRDPAAGPTGSICGAAPRDRLREANPLPRLHGTGAREGALPARVDRRALRQRGRAAGQREPRRRARPLASRSGRTIALQPSGEGDRLGTRLSIREAGRLPRRADERSDQRPAVGLGAVPDRSDSGSDARASICSRPGEQIDLPPEMQVVARRRLRGRLRHHASRSLLEAEQRMAPSPASRSPAGRRSARRASEYPWDLEEIPMAPGDRISYHLELTDNDAVSGPEDDRLARVHHPLPDRRADVRAAGERAAGGDRRPPRVAREARSISASSSRR